MTTRYFVAYDIADPERLRRVHAVVRAFGERVQDSVYELLITPKERARLEGRLRVEMNLKEDQVMFIDMGDAGRTELREVSTLGLPWAPSTRGSVLM